MRGVKKIDFVAATATVEPNGDLYIQDRHGPYSIDADLIMITEEFVASRKISEIQELQTVLSRCQRIVKTAIERKARRYPPDDMDPCIQV